MRKIFTLFVCLFLLHQGYAKEIIYKDQEAERYLAGASLVRITDHSSLPNYVRFRTGEEIQWNQFLPWLASQFKLNPNNAFVELNRSKDAIGYTHIRLQQLVQGYPVVGSMLNVHVKDQKVESFGGVFYDGITLPAGNFLTEQSALTHALSKVNATVYKWQLPSEEAFIQREAQNPLATFYPKGRMVILANKQGFNLCYAFDIYAQEPMGRTLEYVHAQTGEVVLSRNLIEHVNTTGTAVTKYSGTKPMQTDSTAPTSFRLRDASRGLGVQTFDLNNATSYGGAVDFTDADNYWNNVNAQQDEAATDAHWGAQQTYDYLSIVHGRNSIDNAGFTLKSYVHYGSNYNNAFWDGTRMTYGDGATTSGFMIFTGLDVCGHEIGHGLVTYTCDLSATSSGTQECDALNEGYADYVGTSVERFARPTQWDWKMGGDITCTTAGVPNGVGLRLSSNPLAYGDPNCYQGTNWNSSGEPHINAGPLDYWFYTMVMGNAASNITGLGYDTSDNITYRALTVHLFPSADYADARFYSILASSELYGGCSLATITTTNAWNKVCVGGVYVPGPADANFAANTVQTCANTLTVAFSNTSTNINSCMWYFGDGGTSTQFNPTHTYGVGQFTVKLVVYGGTCGNDSLVQTNYIQVGPPSGPATVNDTLCAPGVATLTATLNNPADTIRWFASATGGSVLGTGLSFNTPSISSTTTYYAEEKVMAPVYHVGPLNNSIGNGGNYTNTTRFTIFNCSSPTVLKSVWVFASSAGNRTIILKNAGGTTLQSVTVNIPNGGSVVTLNMPIPVGTGLQLGLATTSAVNLYRNSTGATYPYNNGPISITGNNAAGSATYYYFFYDWVLQADPCYSTRTPATAVIGSGSGITPASVTPSGTVTVCSGNNATLSANTGAGLSYQWLLNNNPIPGANSSTYTPSASGNYAVIVSSSNGCLTPGTSNTVALTISSSPNASVTPSGNQVICSGNSLTLQANTGSGLTYQWHNASGPISGATNSAYTTSTAGTYFVVVSNAAGCTATSGNTQLTVNTAPTALITPSGSVSICTGQTQLINANTGSGYSYQWLLNNNPISGATSSSYSANVAGNYAVLISLGSGCSDTSGLLQLALNPLPAASINASGPTTFCSGGQVTLSANTGVGLTYQWYNGASLLVGATSSTYVANTSGQYTAVVTNSFGCSATSNAIGVTVNSLPIAVTTPVGNVSICSGDSTQILANPVSGYTYQWMLNGSAMNGATNNTIWVSTPGTYAVQVSDVNGCTALSSNTVLSLNTSPTALITPQGPTSFCIGGSVLLNASTGVGYTYQWFLNGNSIAGATANSYSATTSGNYTVFISTSNGCDATSAPINVVVNPLPVAVITCANMTICEGDSTIIQASSGIGYSYQWYVNNNPINGATASSLQVTQAGVYHVVVSTGAGCSATSNAITIVVTPLPTPNIINNAGVLSVSGGPYTTYQWFSSGNPISGATGSTYTPTANGDYSVEVTLNGCKGSAATHFGSLGLDDLDNSSVLISPNPFHDLIVVNGVEVEAIKLVDMAGKVVATSSKQQTLSVQHIAKGIYMLHVYGSQQKIVAIRKVVKD